MSENETTTAEETAVTTLARFEVPSRLEKIEDPNDANHLTFVAEPPLPPSALPARSMNFPLCPVWWKM